MIELRSGALSARIDPLGAELRSLQRAGEEYLWQAQPGVWNQSAPWLFPFVGRLRGGHYTHGGRRFAMPLHGFASRLHFAVTQQLADAVWLEARDTDATRVGYPFAFRLRIGFALHGERELAIGVHLDNLGAETLPFGFGAHPGFALPGGPQDWCLHFEQPEDPQVWRLNDAGTLLATQAEAFAWRAPARLDLGANPFARDALILKQPRSSWVALVHRERGERLRLYAPQMQHLGLWARPLAAYVCIEPWWGHDDNAEAPEALLDKPQLQRLAAGDTFTRWIQLRLPSDP